MQLLCLNSIPSISGWTCRLILPLQPFHKFPSQVKGGEICGVSIKGACTFLKELFLFLLLSLCSLTKHTLRGIRGRPLTGIRFFKKVGRKKPLHGLAGTRTALCSPFFKAVRIPVCSQTSNQTEALTSKGLICLIIVPIYYIS